MKIYIEPRDWWIGYYRGDTHHYVCLLPCIVIRWPRKFCDCGCEHHAHDVPLRERFGRTR